jgi:acylphosphatase
MTFSFSDYEVGMSKICRHCFVSGLVQGVFYRQGTKEQAIAQNLTGWVQNLADGRVEALICGEEERVMDMVNWWLPQGPPRAKVTNVEIKEDNYQELNSFEIIK